MKKIASILVFVLAFTFNTQAQKKRDHKGPKFTVEQQTELIVKKMTLDLDLTNKQQSQIKPLLLAKMAEKKAAIIKRKEVRKTDKKPTSDELFAMKNKMLDNQIAMRNRMKDILNKEQFDKFERMHKKRKMQGKEKGRKGRARNKRNAKR